MKKNERIEVLYCPINNEILLFTGLFVAHNQVMTIYVHGNMKGKEPDLSKLRHIGWL